MGTLDTISSLGFLPAYRCSGIRKRISVCAPFGISGACSS